MITRCSSVGKVLNSTDFGGHLIIFLCLLLFGYSLRAGLEKAVWCLPSSVGLSLLCPVYDAHMVAFVCIASTGKTDRKVNGVCWPASPGQ